MIVVALLFLALCATAQTATIQENALLSFKTKVIGSSVTLESWNTSIDLCTWNGLRCNSAGGVIGLGLESVSVPWPILISLIEDLKELKELRVSRSNFTGSSTNYSLRSCGIEVLELSQNGLTQENFPSGILQGCGNIKAINLSYNHLAGAVPSTLFSSSPCKLTLLDLSNNNFSGKLTSETFSSCADLQHVFLARNNFSQLTFDNCTNLVDINISFNKLSGMLFASATRCSSLKVLAMSHNSFSGSFFSLFGMRNESHNAISLLLPVIERIEARYNKFTGQVPELTGSSIRYLDLSSNNFTSVGNKSICSFNSSLKSLLLQNNRLSGRFFHSLDTCTGLKMLDASFNELTGKIPDNLCENHPQLLHLILWANGFQGHVPSGLANCSHLVHLLLSFNHFEGEIPWQLSELQSLRWLSLSNNKLTGEIPPALTSLHKMMILQLRNNRLHGAIPLELAQCQSLIFLDLSDNFLSGQIPPIGLIATSLWNLQPEVDRNLGDLRYVTPALALPSCRNASGVFGVQGISLEDFELLLATRAGCDSHVGYFPAVTLELSSMIYLDMSRNNLTGDIPSEVGRMQDLLVLGLSNNFLTGTIPESIGTIPTLDTVEMSHNLFHGGIPTTLAHLGTLTRLDISYNNLSGIVPQGPQTCSFIYYGNPGLCNPLESRCSRQNTTVSQGYNGGEGGEDDWPYTTFAIGFVFAVISFVPTAIASFKFVPLRVVP